MKTRNSLTLMFWRLNNCLNKKKVLFWKQIDSQNGHSKRKKIVLKKNPKMMPIPYWDIFLGFDVKVCLSIILMLHFQTDNYILTSWSARRCQWIKKIKMWKKIIRFLEKILIFEEKNVFFNLYFPQSTTWVPSKNVCQYGPAVWLAIANIYIWVNSLII